MTQFELVITDHGCVTRRECEASDGTAVVRMIEEMISNVSGGDERKRVRTLLMRRLPHPEAGACPEHADLKTIHPPAGTNLAAHQGGPICCRCGWSRRVHNIDGQRIDCDGFMEG